MTYFLHPYTYWHGKRKSFVIAVSLDEEYASCAVAFPNTTADRFTKAKGREIALGRLQSDTESSYDYRFCVHVGPPGQSKRSQINEVVLKGVRQLARSVLPYWVKKSELFCAGVNTPAWVYGKQLMGEKLFNKLTMAGLVLNYGKYVGS